MSVHAAGVCGVRGVLGAAAAAVEEEATEMDLGVLGVEKPEAPVLALRYSNSLVTCHYYGYTQCGLHGRGMGGII